MHISSLSIWLSMKNHFGGFVIIVKHGVILVIVMHFYISKLYDVISLIQSLDIITHYAHFFLLYYITDFEHRLCLFSESYSIFTTKGMCVCEREWLCVKFDWILCITTCTWYIVQSVQSVCLEISRTTLKFTTVLPNDCLKWLMFSASKSGA